jgi:hypothetical protein
MSHCDTREYDKVSDFQFEQPEKGKILRNPCPMFNNEVPCLGLPNRRITNHLRILDIHESRIANQLPQKTPSTYLIAHLLRLLLSQAFPLLPASSRLPQSTFLLLTSKRLISTIPTSRRIDGQT